MIIENVPIIRFGIPYDNGKEINFENVDKSIKINKSIKLE